jgi:hypothetical protein
MENRNLILQAGDVSLDIEAANIKALQEEMQDLRCEWDSLLAKACKVAQAMEIPAQFQGEEKRKRKGNVCQMRVKKMKLKRMLQLYSETRSFLLQWTT